MKSEGRVNHEQRLPNTPVGTLVSFGARFKTRLAEGECPRFGRWQCAESFDFQDE